MASEADIVAAQRAEAARIQAEILGRGLPQVAVDPYGRQPNRTSLPDFVANNPNAYAKLVGLTKYNPLDWAKYMAQGPYSLGATNGMVVYSEPKKGQGLAAAAVADLLNRQQQLGFEKSIGANTDSSQVGALGDLANKALDYMLTQYRNRQGAQGGGLAAPQPPTGGQGWGEQVPGMGGMTSAGGQGSPFSWWR